MRTRLINLAYNAALASRNTRYEMGAVLMHKNRVVRTSHNDMTYFGHAEANLFKECKLQGIR